MATEANQTTKDVAKKRIEHHRGFLEEHIDPDTGLLDKLRDSGTLSSREIRRITCHNTFDERNSELLNCILKKHKCDCLVTALRETDQIHIVNYLNENGEYKTEIGEDWPLPEKEVSILNINHGNLVDLLECDELLGHLYSSKIINKRQMDSISSKPTSHEKNKALLECLERRSLRDYLLTIKCLHKTKQSHIGKILEEGGAVVKVHVELDGDDIDQKEDEIISRFQALLLRKSAEDRNRILEYTIIAVEKGQSVILYFYCKTLTELVDLREMQISGKLKTVIEKLFNQLLSPAQYSEVNVDNLKSVDESLFTQLPHPPQITNLTVTLSESEYNRCRSIFPGGEFSPYGLKRRHSGETGVTENWQNIQQNLSVTEGETSRHDPKRRHSDDKGLSENWQNQEQRESVTDFEAEGQPVKTTINELPLELLDIILQKSFLHYALSGKSSTEKRDAFLISRLSSVDFCWFQRLNSQSFKKNIWRHLSKFYEEFHRRNVIFRSNQLNLEENIQPRGLISRLRSAYCLTDVETRLLSRQTLIHSTRKLFRKNNNPDLLHVMRSFNGAKHLGFIRCLHETNQKLTTRVAGSGGALLKAIIVNQDTSKRQSLDQGIKDLRGKTKPVPHQIEKIFSQLKDDDIKFLNTLQDRQTVVWIWCQSQKGLEKIRELNESNSLIDVFTGLTPPSSSPEVNKIASVNICREQFKKSAEHKTEFGGNWPLAEKEFSVLDTNQDSLVDLLELSDLLGLLYSSKVINKNQKELILSKTTSYDRNETLIDMLRKRSLRDYWQTIICLHLSKQSHIAEILEKGGVVVRVRVNLDGENVIDSENEISTMIEIILSDRSTEKTNPLLKLLQHEILAARRGQNIVLYIYCKTIEELQQLHKSLTSGRLKDSAELWFSRLLTRSQKITVASLTVSTDEFQNMRTYFKDDIKVCAILDFDPEQMSSREENELIEILQLQRERGEEPVVKDYYSEDDGNPYVMALTFKRGDIMKTIPPVNIGDNVGWWMARHFYTGKIGFIPRNHVVIDSRAEDQPVKITINKLPLELLDVILQKSYLHHALSGKKSTEKRDEFLLNRLSSVDFCCFQRLNKRRFKKTIWRHLLKFYEEYRRGIVICRSNRSYLEENIQPKGLINRLRSTDCLTDVETRLLRRQTLHKSTKKLFRRNNNPDFLHVMRSFDDAKHSDFIRCLHKSKQKLIARVAENGGVSLKATILIRVTAKRLHQRINDFRDKTKPRSHQMEKLISQLKDNDIEILNCLPDRQTVVWTSCQSHKGLEKIQKLNESSSLLDVFIGLIFPSSSPEINKTTPVSICREQFKKSCVVCLFIVNFTKRLKLEEHESVEGVTKLQNEIYVLCESVIRVFEDRNPFRLQKEIEIEEIKYPWDIESSEKENCLYVTDHREKCVWKITRETDEKHKIIKWLTTAHAPYTLSMSSDGQLLVVSFDSSILRIYGSDAELLRSIELRRHIKKPIHAVETSIGNFIVLHRLTKQEEEEVEEEERTGICFNGSDICEVSKDGQMVIHCFIPSDETQKLNGTSYLSLDSDDRVFVVNYNRVILLDSDLKWNRILCPKKEEHEGNESYRLCYDEEKKQLIVGFLAEEVYIYTLNRK